MSNSGPRKMTKDEHKIIQLGYHLHILNKIIEVIEGQKEEIVFKLSSIKKDLEKIASDSQKKSQSESDLHNFYTAINGIIDLDNLSQETEISNRSIKKIKIKILSMQLTKTNEIDDARISRKKTSIKSIKNQTSHRSEIYSSKDSNISSSSNMTEEMNSDPTSSEKITILNHQNPAISLIFPENDLLSQRADFKTKKPTSEKAPTTSGPTPTRENNSYHICSVPNLLTGFLYQRSQKRGAKKPPKEKTIDLASPPVSKRKFFTYK